MSRFLMGLALLFAACTPEDSKTPFKAVLKSITGSEVTLGLVPQTNSLLLGESAFKCTPENKCTFMSGQTYKDYLDPVTPYTYRVIEVFFLDANGHEIKFFAKYTTLSNHYLGITRTFKWQDDHSSIFKIDPLSGRFEQVTEIPQSAIGPLPTEEKSYDFFLPANMHMESVVQLLHGYGRADMLIQLRFPKFADRNEGKHYLTYSLREIEYWDINLDLVNKSMASMDMKLTLELGRKLMVDLGPEIFRSFDGQAFKVNRDTKYNEEVRFGLFFAQHLNMQLYIQGSADQNAKKLYMDLKEGKLKTSWVMVHFSFLNFLAWICFLAGVGLAALSALPAKYRPWIKLPGDKLLVI